MHSFEGGGFDATPFLAVDRARIWFSTSHVAMLSQNIGMGLMVDIERLKRAAAGGRVQHTGFLSPQEAARVSFQLRSQGVHTSCWGGYWGAGRRVLTVFPPEIPTSDAPLTAVYFPTVDDEGVLRELLLRDGVPKDQLGDIVKHRDGLSVILKDPPHPATLNRKRVGSLEVEPMVVGLELVRQGKLSTKTVVVPSMRADVLGAKAFGVSRTYFGKGVAGGKVYLNGMVAGKSSVVELADEVYAEGVGRFCVEAIEGKTKRGNLKVVLQIEKT